MRGFDRIIDGEIEGVVVLALEIECMEVREWGRGARLAMTMLEGIKRLHEPVVDGIVGADLVGGGCIEPDTVGLA